MPQLLLFPDPRPLVDRLGQEFFRQAPECPGVYLMRDAVETVLYVGKAKNLRKRLASYRVANPDRMLRRHLRLVRMTVRIELQECPDESSALSRESELIRTLRPRFNRAGTWPGPSRFLLCRVSEACLELNVATVIEAGWIAHGPIGASAFVLQGALLRLLWCGIHPERGLHGMPAGWFRGFFSGSARIPLPQGAPPELQKLRRCIEELFAGHPEEFVAWIRTCASTAGPAFEAAIREADLETIGKMSGAHKVDT